MTETSVCLYLGPFNLLMPVRSMEKWHRKLCVLAPVFGQITDASHRFMDGKL